MPWRGRDVESDGLISWQGVGRRRAMQLETQPVPRPILLQIMDAID